jgi:uncharacterized membrane protein YhaH (DUF805 family)
MIEFKKLLAPENRGYLLDAAVFVINAALISVLARLFTQVTTSANSGDRLARLGVILFCFGLAFLQPIAALLKRRRAHEREPYLERPEPSFLFHPACYFLSKLIFLIAGTGSSSTSFTLTMRQKAPIILAFPRNCFSYFFSVCLHWRS